jgi:hypothetical protein
MQIKENPVSYQVQRVAWQVQEFLEKLPGKYSRNWNCLEEDETALVYVLREG